MRVSRPKTPVIFGEVLFDCFPDGRAVPGGAPFNVAWNLQALGAAPLLVSRVGQDDLGGRITRAMGSWGMDRSGLQADPDHPTGSVEVTLPEGEPRFSIPGGQAYDFIATDELPQLAGAGLLYHGSLALRSESARQALEQLRRVTAAPVFLDANLRSPWWERRQALVWLRRARWVKLNEQELELLVPEEPDTPARAESLLHGSLIAALLVTRGDRGVWFRDRQGQILEQAAAPAAALIDPVGAGDAFSAMAIRGLLDGWSWPVILGRALEFAAAVVGLRGATTTDRDFYLPFTRDWERS